MKIWEYHKSFTTHVIDVDKEIETLFLSYLELVMFLHHFVCFQYCVVKLNI
jgi:hypothetical protein